MTIPNESQTPNSGLPWFPCHQRDLLLTLSAMSSDEQLHYVTTLLRVNETGGPISDDDHAMARRTGTTPRRMAAARARLVSTGNLVEYNGGYVIPGVQDQIDEQREKIRTKSKQQRDRAKERWDRKEKNEENQQTSDAVGMPRDNHGTADAMPKDARLQTTDLEKKEEDSRPIAAATSQVIANDPFDKFWAVYPKRKGTNQKKPARKLFQAALARGVDPDEIIAGAKRYAEDMAEDHKIGTPYVARAETWLSKESWERDDAPAVPADQQHFVDKHETRSRFDAWYLHYLLNGDAVAISGMNMAAQLCRRYHVPSEWPQDYDPAKRFPLTMVRQGATHQQTAWYAFFGERRATYMVDEFWRREISLPCEWPPGHQPTQPISDPQPQPIAA
jgi:hypothetical protein